jgi:predicted transcriptional regulator
MRPQQSPCETAVWHILPAIRCETAKELARLGLSQKVISERLGITQPAVSQYISSKRGATMAISPGVRMLILSLAEDAAKGEVLNLNERMCEICTQIQGDESARR